MRAKLLWVILLIALCLSFSVVSSAEMTSEKSHTLRYLDFDVYQPRNSKASAYYRCVEDHFKQLEAVWLPARRAYSSERTIAIRAAKKIILTTKRLWSSRGIC